MIMVVMGGQHDVREEFIRQLMHIFQSRIQLVCVDNFLSPLDRVERLKLFINPLRGLRAITVVNNPTSLEEIALLRDMGAYFAHVKGSLGAIYSLASIRSTDIQCLPEPMPNGTHHSVLTPEQVVSEFLLRMKRKLQAA